MHEDLEYSERCHNCGYYQRIRVEKVKGDIRRMCRNRAIKHDEISMKF